MNSRIRRLAAALVTSAALAAAGACSSPTATPATVIPVDAGTTPAAASSAAPVSTSVSRVTTTAPARSTTTARPTPSATAAAPTSRHSSGGDHPAAGAPSTGPTHRLSGPRSSTGAADHGSGSRTEAGGPPRWAAGLHPPRLVAEPADYTDPLRVAKQYLAVWCYLPPTRPANTNIAAAAAWVTAAGWDDDKSRAMGDVAWAKVQDSGAITVCGPVTGMVLDAAPNTDRRVFVSLSATRYRLAPDGTIIDSAMLASHRRILRADDGRWLVDIAVDAG